MHNDTYSSLDIKSGYKDIQVLERNIGMYRGMQGYRVTWGDRAMYGECRNIYGECIYAGSYTGSYRVILGYKGSRFFWFLQLGCTQNYDFFGLPTLVPGYLNPKP